MNHPLCVLYSGIPFQFIPKTRSRPFPTYRTSKGKPNSKQQSQSKSQPSFSEPREIQASLRARKTRVRFGGFSPGGCAVALGPLGESFAHRPGGPSKGGQGPGLASMRTTWPSQELCSGWVRYGQICFCFFFLFFFLGDLQHRRELTLLLLGRIFLFCAGGSASPKKTGRALCNLSPLYGS